MTTHVATAVAPGLWTVDPVASRAQFRAWDALHKPVDGSLPVLSGRVRVDGDGIPVEVAADLDLAGVETGHARRDSDLRGRRFFDIESSPVLRFTGGPAGRDGDGRWALPGSLLLKGTECPLDVVVELLSTTGASVRVRATTALELRDAGIRVPRLLVGSRVDITVDAQLAPLVGKDPMTQASPGRKRPH